MSMTAALVLVAITVVVSLIILMKAGR